MKTKVRSVYRMSLVKEEGSIELNGKYYVVGEKALRVPHLATHIATTASLVRAYPIFIRYGEEVLGEDISAISIPLEDFYLYTLGKNEIVSELERKTGKKVLPQGLSGLYALREEENVGEKVLLLDGGMRTLNCAVVNGEEVEFCKSFYDEVSVSVLLSYFRQLLEEKYHEIPTTRGLIEKIFEKGELNSGFTKVDVQEEKEKAIELFTERFLELVEREFSSLHHDFEQIVLVGGISYYVRKELLEKLGNIPVLVPEKDAEFMNAKGMHLIEGGTVLDLGYGWAKFFGKGTKEDENERVSEEVLEIELV